LAKNKQKHTTAGIRPTFAHKKYKKGTKQIKNIQQQVFAGGHPPNY
jgi:hypothetical protein